MKHTKTLALLFLLLAIILMGSAETACAAKDASWYGPLEKKVRGIAGEYAGEMCLGVSFIDISDGNSFSIRGDEAFPLASVFKVPIMLAVMKKLDEGQIRLSDRLTIHEWDKCIGSGVLMNNPSGSAVSVQKCMELMITISDNTATDLLWNLIGDDAVNDFIAGLNLTHSNIYIPNRPGYLISLGAGSEFEGKSPDEITAVWKSKSMKDRKKSMKAVLRECKNLSLGEFQRLEDDSASQQTGAAYYSDRAVAEVLDNYCSPNDMAELLRRLYKGELLSKSSTSHCLGVLSRQKYNSRIPGMLPKDIVVYHKTGTICGIVNDAGIIRISSRCPVVLVVLVKRIDEGCSQDASRAIARISRCIYDYYRKNR